MVQSQEPRPLTIGKLSEAGGVGVETVRFYQRKGLLRTPDRAGGFRHYADEDLRRLRFIRQAQTAGFTLARSPSSLSWTLARTAAASANWPRLALRC